MASNVCALRMAGPKLWPLHFPLGRTALCFTCMQSILKLLIRRALCVRADTLQFTALHVCRPLSNRPLKMPCMAALVWAPHVLIFLSDHYTLAPMLTPMTFRETPFASSSMTAAVTPAPALQYPTLAIPCITAPLPTPSPSPLPPPHQCPPPLGLRAQF